MKRRIAAVLAVITIILSGCGKSAQADKTGDNSGTVSSPEATDSVNPPFFKVTDRKTGGVVYMLGTIHVGLEKAVYPEAIYKAIDECDTAAFELDVDALEQDQIQLANAMLLMLNPDAPAAQSFGENYENIKAFFEEKGIYQAVLDYYVPALWTSMLTNLMAQECGFSSDYGTDELLLRYAKSHNKQIYEIESAVQQYRIIAGASMTLQLEELNQAVEDYDEQKEELRKLYQAWSVADEEYFEAMISSDEEVPEEYADDYNDYYAAMYTDRQKHMADCVIEWLKNGKKVFMAVGSAHYYATPDILDYIEDAGYSIEKLSLDETHLHPAA